MRVETFYGIKCYGGRSEINVKKGIHPNYQTIKVTCTTCGNTFETGSTSKELRVDTCSNCHPFYTGKQTFTQADGRVEKFNKRYGLKNEQ